MRILAALTVLFGALCFGAANLGLGVTIGEPPGLSAKYWLGERVAVGARYYFR